jgi:hypothetical protein
VATPEPARLLVSLPDPADRNFERLVCSFARGDLSVEVF